MTDALGVIALGLNQVSSPLSQIAMQQAHNVLNQSIANQSAHAWMQSPAAGKANSIGQESLLGSLGFQVPPDSRVGSELCIRLPESAVYTAKPLMRYDTDTDEMVPVTQEWVEEIQRVVGKLAKERDELRSARMETSVVDQTEADRIWQAVLDCAGR